MRFALTRRTAVLAAAILAVPVVAVGSSSLPTGSPANASTETGLDLPALVAAAEAAERRGPRRPRGRELVRVERRLGQAR